MGKVLVLYDSASGNTAKMAGLVAEGAGVIPGVEVRLRKVEEATPEDVLWCDELALEYLMSAPRVSSRVREVSLGHRTVQPSVPLAVRRRSSAVPRPGPCLSEDDIQNPVLPPEIDVSARSEIGEGIASFPKRNLPYTGTGA
jgi:hypothetical protein